MGCFILMRLFLVQAVMRTKGNTTPVLNSNAGGSVATGRISLAGQVEGDDPH
jgi:hypothetical protein